MTGRKGQYLFKRPGSQNWWLRLQGSQSEAQRKPGAKPRKIVRSLGTPDREQAWISALPYIRLHKLMLYTSRKMAAGSGVEFTEGLLYEPGLHKLPDGGSVVATADTLTYFDANGKPTGKTEPNGLELQVLLELEPDEAREIAPLATVKHGSDDDLFLREWFIARDVRRVHQKEALDMWALFRAEVTDKPLKKCTRDDGKKLALILLGQELKSATVKKKLFGLSTAANLWHRDNKIPINPFYDVVPNRRDAKKRPFLEESDMEKMRAYAPKMRPQDWLLWRLLATTGLRLSEAFEINREYEEEGIRFVIVGTKTATSRRRIPLPESLLAELPNFIKGPLFTETPKQVGQRLGREMKRAGITDDGKCIHSLRHRANTRLRILECPYDIRLQLMGHEKQTVNKNYGGEPVSRLKPYVDQIGY